MCLAPSEPLGVAEARGHPGSCSFHLRILEHESPEGIGEEEEGDVQDDNNSI